MELSDLVIFRAVAEAGGIVKAAGRLHRVQSNVTTRIKQLERSVGVALFHRQKGRLYLSPQGEVLLDYADRLLQLAADAKAALGGGMPEGTLRLGALESTCASRLSDVLARFHERCPTIDVELRTDTNDGLVTAVAGRRLDAAFIAEAPNNDALAFAPLFQETLLLVTAPDRAPVRRASDVAGETVIAFPRGCAYRRILERWLGPRTLASSRQLELASYHAIVACVAAGTGIAIVPEAVLAAIPSARVKRHPLPKVLRRVVTPLVWRHGEHTALIAALLEVARGTRREVRNTLVARVA